MSDSYINLKDFEKFVRGRFKAIVGGKGSVVPRIAVKLKLDEIFSDGASQPLNPHEQAEVCALFEMCRYKVACEGCPDNCGRYIPADEEKKRIVIIRRDFDTRNKWSKQDYSDFYFRDVTLLLDIIERLAPQPNKSTRRKEPCDYDHAAHSQHYKFCFNCGENLRQ